MKTTVSQVTGVDSDVDPRARPCCFPRRLEPLTVIVNVPDDHERPYHIRELHDMRVAECGC